MRTVVGVGIIVLPAEWTVVPPKKSRVIPIRPGRFLARVNFENVGCIVNRERIVPIKHAAHGAIAWPLEAIREGLSLGRSNAAVKKAKTEQAGGEEDYESLTCGPHDTFTSRISCSFSPRPSVFSVGGSRRESLSVV